MKAFLRELDREKRRSERSGAPLSLVLYQFDAEAAGNSHQASELVEALHSSKRVTDILGHVGDGKIAVLCPDTDEAGVKGFMKKIEQGTGDHLCFAGVAATYPDDLFDNLARGTATPTVFQPFLDTDVAGEPAGAYPLKRALDFAGALVLLCLAAPIMLLVAAAVRLTSRGPVIFKQTRVGRGAYPFTFYKFRSMQIDGDDSVHRAFVTQLIEAGDGAAALGDGAAAAFKIRSDSRVTPIGRLIRRTSLDELPQLFNVLKGDMSLVGPRPPIPYEATKYQPWHLRRLLSVNPGMTGIWQVEGRSRVPFNEMVRMDLRYIRNCSFWLDLRILAKTLPVVLSCEGAD